MIFLDNASGIPPLEEVKSSISQNLNYSYNPSSSYSLGQKINSEIQKTRNLIGNIFNITPNNVIFTSGGAESNNLAIFGYKNKRNTPYSIAYLGFEHNSIIKPLKYLKKQGHNLVKLNYDDIINNINKTIKILKENKVSFLALSHSYPNIGILLPLEKIVKKIKKELSRIHIHVDIAQSFMKADLTMANIDSISISGHKIGALKGVGALILKNKQLISSTIMGGKQNFSLRSGTENVLGILSFKDAIKVWNKNKELFRNNLLDLNIYFRKQFEIVFSDNKNVKLITPNENYSKNIITIAIKDILSEHIIRFLDENQIMISASSTCSDLNYKPPFLDLINLPKEFHNGIIRISFSPFNKNSEIDSFFDYFRKGIEYFK